MSNVYRTFKQTVDRYGMLPPGKRVLLAYSGGSDSSALLGLLLTLRKERMIEIYLGHFNHQLRAAAADDERFVREAAGRFRLPLEVGRGDVKEFARRHRLNLEEASRRLRYDFLKSAAGRIGNCRIATAHTLTDQTETVFMRIMRGSGPLGLSGIFPCMEGGIIRPLLSLTRNDIQAYLEENGMTFRVDDSNADRRYLRNRIRLDLLPLLREKYDARIESHVDRLTSILREEERFMEKLTHEKAREILVQIDGMWTLDLSRMKNLDTALRRRVAREFFRRIKGDLRRVSLEDVETILNLKEGRAFDFKSGITLEREHGIVRRVLPRPDLPAYALIWEGDEDLEIEPLGLRFHRRCSDKTPGPEDFDDRNSVWLDAGKLSFPLRVRSPLEGDRYRPLGAPGRRNLKDVMREKRIPRALRDRLPVFVCGGDIVWIPGLPVGDVFKIDGKTREVVGIEMTVSASDGPPMVKDTVLSRWKRPEEPRADD